MAPFVRSFHYAFDDWGGSALVTSFPCFVVTNIARHAIEEARLSGMVFDEVLVTTSAFDDLNPSGLALPDFVWLKVHGVAGKDDFGIASNNNLVVSQRALDLLDSPRDPGRRNIGVRCDFYAPEWACDASVTFSPCAIS